MVSMAKKNDSGVVMAGECQVCFRSMVIHDQLLVLHGYERPGHGYIVGNCWGMANLPYELSCEVTKGWQAHLADKVLPGHQAHLKELQTPGTKAYTTFVVTKTWGRYNDKKSRTFVVVEGQPLPEGWDEVQALLVSSLDRGAPDFDRMRSNAIFDAEQRINEIEGMIRFLGKRITNWTYAPERLQPRAKHVTRDREAELAGRATEKAAREAKKAVSAARMAKRSQVAIDDIQAMRATIAALRQDKRVMARARQDGHFVQYIETSAARKAILTCEIPTTTWTLSDLRGDLKDYLAILKAASRR